MSQNLVQLNKMVRHKPKKIIFFPLSITEDNGKSADWAHLDPLRTLFLYFRIYFLLYFV